MNLYDVMAILLALTALFVYVSHRFLPLHPTVGAMLLVLVTSAVLIVVGEHDPRVKHIASLFLEHVDLNQALLRWMLGFLLFAGALSIDLSELARQRWPIAAFSIVTTIASTFVVGGLMALCLHLIEMHVPWRACLIFGALISPTDPIAVVATMKRVGAPATMETIVSAESLFNDGVGVVLFLTMLQLNTGDGPISVGSVAWLFLRESIGGIAVGLVLGAIVYQMLKRVYAFPVEVLLTLALAMGCYALADALHMSGPLAAVSAGLLIGNPGRTFHLPESARGHLADFWDVVDKILNAILFVLIGLEVLLIEFTRPLLIAAALAVGVSLLARWLSVFGTITLTRLRLKQPGLIVVLTWGGLRGGLAVAMALSLSPSLHREVFLPITYGVVLFSMLIQGSTMPMLIRRYVKKQPVAQLAT